MQKTFELYKGLLNNSVNKITTFFNGKNKNH